jgi:hypothetical protein
MIVRGAPAPTPARARGAVSLCFFVSGVVFASLTSPCSPAAPTEFATTEAALAMLTGSTKSRMTGVIFPGGALTSS